MRSSFFFSLDVHDESSSVDALALPLSPTKRMLPSASSLSFVGQPASPESSQRGWSSLLGRCLPRCAGRGAMAMKAKEAYGSWEGKGKCTPKMFTVEIEEGCCDGCCDGSPSDEAAFTLLRFSVQL